MSISAARRAEFVGISGRAVLAAQDAVVAPHKQSSAPPRPPASPPRTPAAAPHAQKVAGQPHVNNGPQQGADAGHRAERDAAREDAGYE